MRINGIKYHLLVSFLLLLFDSCGKTIEVEDLCEGILCQNNGICLDGTCECETGFSGPNCEQEVSSDLKLRTQFGSTSTLKVATDGIYAIWWDPQFDHTDDLPTLFGWLNEIRTDCLTNLGLEDPPNPAAGYYYNVYIHHGEADILPNSWGNGQGTDSYGMPFLTLPEGAHLEYGNVLHEGFHIFQYSANSPGFAYSGDSQWYVESAAQWYAAQNEPDGIHTFIEAGAITGNPHLALWHSFSNEAPGDPKDWLFQVRQYGMHTYLYYLTEIAGVDSDIISGGFYAESALSPQEYHFQKVGGDQLRTLFADWAAHNTGGLDYLSQEQIDRALLEVQLAGDVNNLHPYVLELTDEEAQGSFSPPVGLAPRGWSYNVMKINNSEAVNYTFTLRGDSLGSEGAEAHLEAQIVVMQNNEPTYYDMQMADRLSGELSIDVTDAVKEIFFIVAAVPEHFSGNQTYGYAVDIERK